MKPFEYHEALPPAEVAPVVLSFWAFHTTHDCPAVCDHTVWPDGCTSIVVCRLPGHPAFSRCIAGGVESSTTSVPRGSQFWGLRFWPDTGAHVLGVCARDIADGDVPPLFAASAAALVSAVGAHRDPKDVWPVLAEWSLAHIAQRTIPDVPVREAIRHIVEREGDVPMHEVATASGIGVRQLQRRFTTATGLTLKGYARVRRMRSVLARQLGGSAESWSAAAATGGYADQAHLAREFSQLTGLAPRAVMQHLARIEHRNVTP